MPDNMMTASTCFSASALIVSDALICSAQDIEQVCTSDVEPTRPCTMLPGMTPDKLCLHSCLTAYTSLAVAFCLLTSLGAT